MLRERFGVERPRGGARDAPQRRTFTYLDDAGERTITVLGERIVPLRSDPLPWDALAELDAIYLTGGDAGAVRAARAARVLVATPRAMGALAASGVRLDVLVRSASDPGERYEPGMLDPAPRWVVSTRGEQGGSWTGETSGRVAGDGAARPAGRRLRLRRLVRRRARLRPGGRDVAAGGDRARGALRGGVPDGPRAVRGAAHAGVTRRRFWIGVLAFARWSWVGGVVSGAELLL